MYAWFNAQMKKQQCRRIVKNELKLQRNGTEREKNRVKTQQRMHWQTVFHLRSSGT